MASQLVLGFGFAAVLIMWAAVLGTVERRERFAFGLGVLLVIAAMSFLPGASRAAVAVAGIAVVLASTVPLLRESV